MSINQLIEKLVKEILPTNFIVDAYWLCSNWKPKTVPWYTCGLPLGFCAAPRDLTNELRSVFNKSVIFEDQYPITKREWEISGLGFYQPGEYWLNPFWMPSDPTWHSCGIPLGYCATAQHFADRVQYVYDKGYLYDSTDYGNRRKWYALRMDF